MCSVSMLTRPSMALLEWNGASAWTSTCMMLSSSGQVLGQSKDLQAELAEGSAEQAAGQANQCGAEERVGEAAQTELAGGYGDQRLDVHQGELAAGDRLEGDAGAHVERREGRSSAASVVRPGV
jgi:hypothetical protein